MSRRHRISAFVAPALMLVIAVVRICGLPNAALRDDLGGSFAMPTEYPHVISLARTETGLWQVVPPRNTLPTQRRVLAVPTNSNAQGMLRQLRRTEWYDPMRAIAEVFRIKMEPQAPIAADGTQPPPPGTTLVPEEISVIVTANRYDLTSHKASSVILSRTDSSQQ